MQTKPTKKFVELISALAGNFGRETDESMFLGYWVGLKSLSIESVSLAVERAIVECDRMPHSKELRELAGEMSHKQRAVLAWEEFRDAVEKHGYYDSVDFADPVINATVRNLGGWEYVSCIEDAEEFDVWLRKKFEQVYVAKCGRRLGDEEAAALPGAFMRQNARDGYLGDDRFKPEAIGAQPVVVGTKLPALAHNRGLVPKRLAGGAASGLLELQKAE